MTLSDEKQIVPARTRLTVESCPIGYVQGQLMQVFDRPAPTGPRLYQDPSGRRILDLREQADVRLQIWWTFGQPVDSSLFDEEQLDGWLAIYGGDRELSRGLFLTDVSVDPTLQDRFGVRPNVLVLGTGRGVFVVISYADDPSETLAVSRLFTASEVLAC